MSEAEGFGLKNSGKTAENAQQTNRHPVEAAQTDCALTNPAAVPAKASFKLRWAAGALRLALPLVQRILLPKVGNIAATAASLLFSPLQTSSSAQPVDLEPIEDRLAKLGAQHHGLHNQIIAQNEALGRIEEQLEKMRGVADRTAQEQQELLDDLKSVANKVNIFAFVAVALLAVSVLMNVLLYFYIRQLLHLL
jgi:hypothetical protein